MKPQHILAPIDLTETSRAGLRFASVLARQFGAELTVVHVEMASAVLSEAMAGHLEGRLGIDADHVERVRRRVRAFVEEALGGQVPRIEVIEDIFVAEAIVRYTEERGIDWICMSAVGRRGAQRFFLGNTATEVLRSSPVPVLTVRGPGENLLHDDFRRVLVAVDLDATSRKVVAAALDLVRPKGEITLVHVIEAPPEVGLYGTALRFPAEDLEAAREWSETVLCRLVEDLPEEIVAPVRVEPGRPADTILALERELQPDLTVIGTHGRHGIEHLMLGSVAERVVRHANGPVLVVPTRGR
jgi:nucleotide-binding universal stress UspA family protein